MRKLRVVKSGFTLIEALVAITVLLIGVLGPMTAATRGITDGLYAGNQLVGTYLAQEGLELLSTQIINNHNSFVVFLTNLDSCLTSSGPGCAVIVSTGASVDFEFQSCNPANGGCDVAYDSTAGFYKLVSSIPTGSLVGPAFTRVLTVESLTANDKEVLLKSTVKWKNKPGDATQKIFELTKYAFDQS